jgi:hypothetical protein
MDHSNNIDEINKKPKNVKNIIFNVGMLVVGITVFLVCILVNGFITNPSKWNVEGYFRPKTYVTMTTLPDRLVSSYFKKVIDKILKQNVDYIVLNIPEIYKRDNSKYIIPDWVMKHDRIIVNRCEDEGPITKILGGLDIIPKYSIVIILDDDIIYKDFIIDGLQQHFTNNPKGVSCWNTYHEKDWEKEGFNFLIPGGFSGCVSAGSTLRQLKTLYIPKECFIIDDHWLGWAYNKLGIHLESIDEKLPWNHSTESLYDHPSWFELRLHTNRQVAQRNCKKALNNNEIKNEIK